MEEFRYRVITLPKAEEHILAYKKAGNKIALARIDRIRKELGLHPETGIGKPEKLKHNLSGFWSREVDKKNRMIYEIKETEIIVYVHSAITHYDDK
jgi:toxin YoeB